MYCETGTDGSIITSETETLRKGHVLVSAGVGDLVPRYLVVNLLNQAYESGQRDLRQAIRKLIGA